METPAGSNQHNERFAIPGVAEVEKGKGGLRKVRVTAPAASGEMYLHGAHVTSWKPAGQQEVLFVSPHSLWADGHAIRGGVPICFPWFGDKADDPHAPAHGFVRAKEWQLQSIEQSGDAVTVSMFTASDENTKRWWPADFRLLYRATFARELTLELVMTNAGSSPLHFEEALHAYHRVEDVTKGAISGLDGVHYLDKTDSFREKTQTGDIEITAETDRVYLNTEHAIDILDPVLQRRIHIEKQTSQTTVVWNPWIEKAQALSDLGGDQWKKMLCVETSNVGNFAVELAPSQQHIMKATISIGSL